MNPETIEKFIPQFYDMATSALLCIVIMVIGWSVAGWLGRIAAAGLKKKNVDLALSKFLASLVRYIALAGTVVAALGTVGIETTSLVALLGSAGIAIGLALQGNLSHFASGVMILLFRPFSIGDVVTAGGHTGGVVEIGLFATTLHTPDNEKIIVPNGAVTSGSIVNVTTLGTRRGHIAISVAYGEDMPKVNEVLLAAATRSEFVLAEPAPAVAFVNFGASALDFDVMTWSNSNMDDYLGMLHEVRTNIYDDLNAAGIDIPYDQIVVHKV